MASSEILPFSDEGAIVVEPEAILDIRWVKSRARFREERLVKWRMLDAADATWESTAKLVILGASYRQCIDVLYRYCHSQSFLRVDH